MRILYPSEDRVLAADATRATNVLQRGLGYMFRSEPSEGSGLVFKFDTIEARAVHMLFVRFPLDVLWLVDGEVTKKETLQPWTGIGSKECDTIIELPAGTAVGIQVGDIIETHVESPGA